MNGALRLQVSRRLLQETRCQHARLIVTSGGLHGQWPSFRRPQHRSASTRDQSKPIVLEKPDKFRPPSHPSKLVKPRGRASSYNGAYNQSSTASEREAQRTRRYPHTFPEKGTWAYSMLTNRTVHSFVTMVSRWTIPLQTACADTIIVHLIRPGCDGVAPEFHQDVAVWPSPAQYIITTFPSSHVCKRLVVCPENASRLYNRANRIQTCEQYPGRSETPLV
jgi:hypothetical protein